MTRICALPGCGKDIPEGRRRKGAKYCSPACSYAAKIIQRRHAALGSSERWRRRREAGEFAPPLALKQQPPQRPVWRIEWHPLVRIGPDRPAPVRRYRDAGRAYEFQDDLAAMADKGSPRAWTPARQMTQTGHGAVALAI